MKNILFLLLGLIITSCNKENKCIKKNINAVFIKELLVVKNTCKTFKNYNSVKYYDKDTLLMSGFGDRITKQGQWKFFKNNEIIAEGLFKESQPIRSWNYKNIGNLNWVVYTEEVKGFRLSIPKNWSIVKEKNIITFFNGNNFDNHTLKVSVTVVDVNEPLDIWVNKFLKYQKQMGAYSLKSKKIELIDIEDSYEINYMSKYEGFGEFKSSEFIFRFKNRTYAISISLKLGSKYDFNIIEEQILYSFEMYEKPDGSDL